MIDIHTETLLNPSQACREPVLRNPRTGKPADLSKFYRLIQQGARDANGARVRLETIRTPSGLQTSREAIQRFVERLTDPDGTSRESAPPRTSSQRQRAAERADRECALAGF